MITQYVQMCRVLAIVWVALLLCLNAQAVQLIDDRGVTVTLPTVPMRIVSLLPSLTESVCELGQCRRLVGVDRYSNYPLSVQKLPQVGGGLDPNIEMIFALKPDVVLLAKSSRAAERLEALGLKVVALETKTHADVERILLKLGQLLDVADAQRVWRLIDAGFSAAAQSVPAHARGIRVYFEVNQGPYAAGPSSFMGETLTRLGVKNIIPPQLGPFPKLNPEFVVRANPDIIMVAQSSVAGMVARPGWQMLQAVKEQRVCSFNAEDGNILVRPGPRMAEAARLMVQCLATHAARPQGVRP